jgi:hypothetical protein
MKKLLASIVLSLFFISTHACVLVHKTPTPSYEIRIPLFNSGKSVSLSEFIDLKPSEYKKITGRSLTIVQWISLKLVQSKLKRLTKSNPEFPPLNQEKGDATDHILWFLLGFCFFPYALLISLFINDPKHKDRLLWVGKGSIAILVITFLLIILIVATFTSGGGYR